MTALVIIMLRRLKKLKTQNALQLMRIQSLEEIKPVDTSKTDNGLTDKSTQRRGKQDNEFYKKFISILTPLLTDTNLSVEMLAEKIGLSQSQLNRRIKSLTRHTTVEMIRKLRVATARKKLLKSKDTISEIAQNSGFTSHAYFSKCYREEYGESPQETRLGGNSIKNDAKE